MKARLLLVSWCWLLHATVVSAVTCHWTGLPDWSMTPHYYDTQTLAQQACQAYAAQVGKSCNGPYNCTNSAAGDCSWRAGYVEYWIDTAARTQHQYLWCGGTPATPACPDTDSDGVKDPCDACPNNPDVTSTEITYYRVPNGKICGGEDGGKYYYKGETCGYSKSECTGDPTYVANDDGMDVQEMLHCCGAAGSSSEDCVVDDQCVAHKGDVCTCPDGIKDCVRCPDGKCECPDTDNDGTPDSPCMQCKKSDCTCPDADSDGQPDASCLSCQDTDGDGIPDDQDPDVVHPGDPGDPGDPNEPADPGDEPPTPNDIDDKLPDDLTVAGCTVDIRQFKQFWTSGDSFPFNWFYAFVTLISSLFTASTSPPELLFTQALPNNLGTLNIPVGLSALSVMAFVSRWSITLVFCWHVGPYMLGRYKSLFGVE